MNEKTKETVKIEKVSEITKGILANNQWYSTKGKVQEYISKDLEGATAEVSKNAEGTIIFLKKLSGGTGQNTQQQQKPQHQYSYRDNDRVTRHGLLNTAIEFLKANQTNKEKISFEDVILTAESFKGYVETGALPDLRVTEEEVVGDEN